MEVKISVENKRRIRGISLTVVSLLGINKKEEVADILNKLRIAL